jgi:hypothetical protein
MSYLTNGDLRLIFSDMVENKWDLLMRFAVGPIYGKAVKEHLADLTDLESKLEKRPLAEQLKETDLLHDAIGRSIFYLEQSLGNLPLLSKEKRDLVAKVKDAFIPRLVDLTRSYQDEADAAKQRRRALDGMKTELKAFPVAPDLTLFDMVEAFLNAGEGMDRLLKQRAAAVSTASDPDAVNAGAARTRALSLLTRLRETIRGEIDLNPELQAKLEVDLFSYYDQLDGSRNDQASASKPAPAAPPTA